MTVTQLKTAEPPPDVPTNLAAALVALQASMPAIITDQPGQIGNRSYKYANLTKCTEKLYPVMAALGLAFTAKPTTRPVVAEVDGQLRVVGTEFGLAYTLLHAPSGEKDEGFWPLGDPARISSQDMGIKITYAKRYALVAITGAAPGDDDNDAQGEAAKLKAAQQGTQNKAQRGRGKQADKPADTPADPAQVAGSPGQVAAAALAELAAKLVERGATVAELRAQTHEPARKKALLKMPVPNPFHPDHQTAQLHEVITAAKAQIDAKAKDGDLQYPAGEGHGN